MLALVGVPPPLVPGELPKSGLGLALPRPGPRMEVRTFPRSGRSRDIGLRAFAFLLYAGFGRWGLGVSPFIWGYYSSIDGRKVKM